MKTRTVKALYRDERCAHPFVAKKLTKRARQEKAKRLEDALLQCAQLEQEWRQHESDISEVVEAMISLGEIEEEVEFLFEMIGSL